MNIQKTNYEELIKKLKTEHNDLCKKIDHLEKFFQNETFNELNTYHKNLLVQQHVFMCAYCNILAQRILDLNGVE